MNDLLTVALIAMTTAWLTNIVSQSRLLETPRKALQGRFERRWIKKNSDGPAEEALLWDTAHWLSKGAYFLECTWCTGTWIAIPVTLVSDMTVGLSMPPLLVYGASAFIAGRYGS